MIVGCDDDNDAGGDNGNDNGSCSIQIHIHYIIPRTYLSRTFFRTKFVH